MKVYRTGIIGVGFIGKVHLETVRRLGNVEVVALADKFLAREVAEQLNVPNAFEDYREMIDTMNLDVVHICTPNNTHFEMTMYALDHGVNVVLEKPMAVTIEEAELMRQKAEETGLTCGINFHNRFYPMTNHLMNIIRDGELGDIFTITGRYTQDWLLYDTDYSWRLESATSGNTRAVADIGSHWMDLAQFVSGQKITAVCADFQTIHPYHKKPKGNVLAFSAPNEDDEFDLVPIDTEDNACVMLRFEGGAKGTAFFSQVIAGSSVDIDLLVGGYKKSAEWNSSQVNHLKIGKRDSFNEVGEKGATIVHKNTLPLIAYPLGHHEGFVDAFKQCFREIYESIDNKDKEYHYATFADGVYEMKVCDTIFQSAKEQRWIEIK